MKKIMSAIRRILLKEKQADTKCATIKEMLSETREIRSRVERMKATINGEDKWMLTLKERHE